MVTGYELQKKERQPIVNFLKVAKIRQFWNVWDLLKIHEEVVKIANFVSHIMFYLNIVGEEIKVSYEVFQVILIT